MITENSTKQEILNAIAEDQEVVNFLGGIDWFLELNAPLIF